jgi:hypothetical protein
MATVTIAEVAPMAPDSAADNSDRPVPKAPSGRSSPAVTARRQVAERLRRRREREEQLIVSAAGALGRRAVALEEAAAAGHILATAIRDLQDMGFSLDDVAEVLEVSADELARQPTPGVAKTAATRGKRTRG